MQTTPPTLSRFCVIFADGRLVRVRAVGPGGAAILAQRLLDPVRRPAVLCVYRLTGT